MASPDDLLAQTVELEPVERWLAEGLEAGETRFLRRNVRPGVDRVVIAWSTGTMTFVASFNLWPTDLQVLLKKTGGKEGFALWLQGFNERRNADKIDLVANSHIDPDVADDIINKQVFEELTTIAGMVFGAAGAAAGSISAANRLGQKGPSGRRITGSGGPPRKILSGKVIGTPKALPERAEALLAKEVDQLTAEHRSLSVANARLALIGPVNTVRRLIHGAGSILRGDIVFVGEQGAKLLRREVKVVGEATFSAFDHQITRALKGMQVRSGDEIFVQVPRGTNVLDWLTRYRGKLPKLPGLTPDEAAKPMSRGSFVDIQIRDPDGALLYWGPLI